jgi:hypothetical protein
MMQGGQGKRQTQEVAAFARAAERMPALCVAWLVWTLAYMAFTWLARVIG